MLAKAAKTRTLRTGYTRERSMDPPIGAAGGLGNWNASERQLGENSAIVADSHLPARITKTMILRTSYTRERSMEETHLLNHIRLRKLKSKMTLRISYTREQSMDPPMGAAGGLGYCNPSERQLVDVSSTASESFSCSKPSTGTSSPS